MRDKRYFFFKIQEEKNKRHKRHTRLKALQDKGFRVWRLSIETPHMPPKTPHKRHTRLRYAPQFRNVVMAVLSVGRGQLGIHHPRRGSGQATASGAAVGVPPASAATAGSASTLQGSRPGTAPCKTYR